MTRRLGITLLVLAVGLIGLALTGAVLAEGRVVTLTKQDCRRLSVHVPDPGVAYQPGVDVNGRPVTPADLGGAPAQDIPELAIPETVTIEIEVDLQDRFGIPDNANAFKGDAKIGKVEVDRDGRARFNGQPLQDAEQYELTRRCQEILYGRSQAKKP